VAVLILKVAILIGLLQFFVAYIVWVERRVLARMQSRSGPNRVGFGVLATLPVVGPLFSFTAGSMAWGLGQPIADGVKLFLKEDIEPAGVDRWTYRLAPILALLPAFVGFAVIPFGPDIEIFGRSYRMGVAELRVDLIFLLALGSLGSYGIILAGWASNSKYSIMGALRATAQLVSYELPMGLALLVVVLLAGSMNLSAIIGAQAAGWWNICSQPIAFLVALICAVAEANRAPFDLSEAESELVAGFHTEYSGMRFALFFLAEYAHMFLGGSLLAVAFLGGWKVPFLALESTPWWLAVVAFGVKVNAFMLLCIWLRATLPRFRYDQLMKFAWKILVPLVTLNLLATAIFLKIFGNG
jgi:NADH-quinone oxidoreductase subunit H